jgi:hypothetical protein
MEADTLAASAAVDTTAAEQLAEMIANRKLDIGGRNVTIHEYTFFEGLEVANDASDFIADLSIKIKEGSLRYSQVRRLYGKHSAQVKLIAARAGDVEVSWLEGLTRDESETYMATWFAVNSAFFVLEAVAETREALAREVVASVGTTHSPDSPAQESDQQTSSDGATPSDS